MKKLYKKLKSVNKQIAEAETAIENIRQSPDTFYRSGEKTQDIAKYLHWIGELKESKIKILLELVAEAGHEIQLTKEIQSHVTVA